MDPEGAVTDTGESFTLTRGRPYQVSMVAWFAVWSALLVWFLVSAVRDGYAKGAFGVFYVLMLGYGAVALVRLLRTRIDVTPETLVVRNPWRTYRLARADIAGFSTGRFQRIGHQTVYADRRDGSAVRLVVIEPQFSFPGRERSVEPVLDRLEGWRTGAGDPER